MTEAKGNLVPAHAQSGGGSRFGDACGLSRPGAGEGSQRNEQTCWRWKDEKSARSVLEEAPAWASSSLYVSRQCPQFILSPSCSSLNQGWFAEAHPTAAKSAFPSSLVSTPFSVKSAAQGPVLDTLHRESLLKPQNSSNPPQHSGGRPAPPPGSPLSSPPQALSPPLCLCLSEGANERDRWQTDQGRPSLTQVAGDKRQCPSLDRQIRGQSGEGRGGR